MKKNKIIGALALLVLGSSPAFAEIVNGDFKASAEVENTCLIEADDVNFGQVYAPLTQQGTKSEMRVLCSKGTSYTVDLNYGGNFVDTTGGSSTGYTVEMSFKYLDSKEEYYGYGNAGYRIYKDGKPISAGGDIVQPINETYDYFTDNLGEIACYGNNGSQNKIYLRTQETVDLLYPGTSIGWVEDTKGLCTGKTGRLNMDNWNSFAATLGGSVNDKGAMIGAMKGNSLAYQITLPGDITKPWISNVNTYQATASGEFDKIEVNARIMPDSSSSLYPAQDSYFDTVTAVISY